MSSTWAHSLTTLCILCAFSDRAHKSCACKLFTSLLCLYLWYHVCWFTTFSVLLVEPLKARVTCVCAHMTWSLLWLNYSIGEDSVRADVCCCGTILRVPSTRVQWRIACCIDQLFRIECIEDVRANCSLRRFICIRSIKPPGSQKCNQMS